MSEYLNQAQNQTLEQTVNLIHPEEQNLTFIDRTKNLAHTAIESVRSHGREMAAVAMGTLALGGVSMAEASSRQDKMANAFTYQEYIEKKTKYDEIGTQIKAYQLSVNPDKSSHNIFYEELGANPQLVDNMCVSEMYGETSYSIKGNRLRFLIERKDDILLKKPVVNNGRTNRPVFTIGSNNFSGPTTESSQGSGNYEFACSDLADIDTSVELWKSRLRKVKQTGDNFTRIHNVKSINLPRPQGVYKTGPEGTNVNNSNRVNTDVVTFKVSKSVASLARQKKLYPVIKIKVNSKIGLYKDMIREILQPVDTKKRVKVDVSSIGERNSPVGRYGNRSYPKISSFNNYTKAKGKK